MPKAWLVITRRNFKRASSTLKNRDSSTLRRTCCELKSCWKRLKPNWVTYKQSTIHQSLWKEQQSRPSSNRHHKSSRIARRRHRVAMFDASGAKFVDISSGRSTTWIVTTKSYTSAIRPRIFRPLCLPRRSQKFLQRKSRKTLHQSIRQEVKAMSSVRSAWSSSDGIRSTAIWRSTVERRSTNAAFAKWLSCKNLISHDTWWALPWVDLITLVLSLSHPQATHSDELNFQCDLCDKRFRLKKNLQVHKKRHQRSSQ